MKEPSCPRCGGLVHEPNAWSSAWRCDVHGNVDPLYPAYQPSREGMDAILRKAAVPVWLPWPLPPGWLVTGFAGLGAPDPGPDFAAGPPNATVSHGGHEFPLWHVQAPDRAAFVGEVMGHWLWVVLWPDTAGVLLVQPLSLRDLRDPGQELDIPFGALSPRLASP